MAPSFNVNVLSGTIRSGSISIFEPIPLHSGHAPCGALKENILGVSSSKFIPQSTQAKCSEYFFSYSSSPLSNKTVIRPSVNSAAVSNESTSLLLKSTSFLILSLSTTTSMLCLYVFASSMSSSRSLTSPSTRTLTKPLFLKSSRTSLN